jgi:hypothetical protein
MADDPTLGEISPVGPEPEGGGGPPGPETALFGTLNDILNVQLGTLRQQADLYTTLLPGFRDLFLAQNSYALSAVQTQSMILPIATQELYANYVALGQLAQPSTTETLATQTVDRYLSGQSVLTPEDLGRLDTIFARQRTLGEESITRFAEDAAAARGLRLTDTPIGQPALEQIRELGSDLGAARAQAELGLEQQRAQFAEAVRQFGTNLRASALQNRAAMAGGFVPGFGGGGGPAGSLPTVGAPDTGSVTGLLGQLTGQRSAAALQASGQAFQAGQGALNRQNAVDVANVGHPSAGALGYLTALAPVAAAALQYYSTARLKRGIAPLRADEYDAALDRVRATPIVRYRYRWEPDQGPLHIGPILELAPPEISDDGVRVNVLDYSGLLHAGLKAVDRRVARLETRLAPPGRRRG